MSQTWNHNSKNDCRLIILNFVFLINVSRPFKVKFLSDISKNIWQNGCLRKYLGVKYMWNWFLKYSLFSKTFNGVRNIVFPLTKSIFPVYFLWNEKEGYLFFWGEGGGRNTHKTCPKHVQSSRQVLEAEKICSSVASICTIGLKYLFLDFFSRSLMLWFESYKFFFGFCSVGSIVVLPARMESVEEQ